MSFSLVESCHVGLLWVVNHIAVYDWRGWFKPFTQPYRAQQWRNNATLGLYPVCSFTHFLERSIKIVLFCSVLILNIVFKGTHIYDTIDWRYDTIRDAILTCARKPTRVSLIYRTEPTTKKCEKVAHTRLPSVGFRGWSRFLAVSLRVTWVINPAVGCNNLPPGLQLSPQPLRGLLPVLLLGEQTHDGCEQFA